MELPQTQVQKPIQFTGKAGGYFLVSLLSAILGFVPLIGMALSFNYVAKWTAENSLVNGRKVVYKAGLGETFVFLFINILVVLITLGIYFFWFVPKSYRYRLDHLSYADEAAPAVADMPPAPLPVAPLAPVA